MTDTPRRLFMAVGALAVIWIVTFWLYEPTPPPVTFGDRPASLTERDLSFDPEPQPPAPAPEITPAAAAEPAPTTTAPARRIKEYTVAKGDTSWEAVAHRTLGDRARAGDIAAENPLVDPKKLIPGRTVLRIPLDPAPRPIAGTPKPVPPVVPSDEMVYITNSGDTLTGIAKQVYGQSSLWQIIYGANKDRIANPNRVPQGLTIRIPPPPARRPAKSGA